MTAMRNSQIPHPKFQILKRVDLGFGFWVFALMVAWALAVPAHAQQMPDPSLINGKAIPAGELPAGTVTVRVVKESIGNNLPGQKVSVTVGGKTLTATTDDQGRAEFKGLPEGSQGRAEVTVDGEHLASDPFPVPSSGGLRVILISGLAQAAERKKEEDAKALAAPPVKGVVVLGGNTRIVMQFADDVLEVFYQLEIVNNARSRVDIGGPFVLDLPRGAEASNIMEGSSPTAKVSGRRLVVTGPFAPGTTPVQLSYRLPYTTANLTFEQPFPVALEQVTFGAQKLGNMSMSSQQFLATNESQTDSGTVYLVGSGAALRAGTTLTVNLSGLPVRSQTPRYTALGLALAIIGLGVWLTVSGRNRTREAHDVLVKRRDALLADLAQLESKHRAGTLAADRYATRRQRILVELEQIYGELDEASAGPQGGGEGVAA
jgi:hypothetical protein